MIFDVVIPTYNNLEELKLCLKGFEKQRFRDFRLIVCVNGYEDGTVEYLTNTSFINQTIVCQHANRKNNGRPANRNLALEHLQAKYVCFFDSDLVPDVQLLQNHYNLLDTENCISIGSVSYLDENNIWATYLSSRGAKKYKDGQHIPFQYFNTQNIAFKKEYFVDLQGFDPLITAYGGDDTEFSYRLFKKFNLPTIVNKAANGTGIMYKTLEKGLSQMQEFGKSSLPYILNKHPDFDEIFQIKLYQKPIIRTLYFVLSIPIINRLMLYLVKALPSWLSKRIIHLLVFKNILNGYLSIKKARKNGL